MSAPPSPAGRGFCRRAFGSCARADALQRGDRTIDSGALLFEVPNDVGKACRHAQDCSIGRCRQSLLNILRSSAGYDALPRGSPNSSRNSCSNCSGHWLGTWWSAASHLRPEFVERTITCIWGLASLARRTRVSHGMSRTSEWKMHADNAGNRCSSSKASDPEYAVMTLNFAVSSTSLRAEMASGGSGSAIRKLGRVIMKP